MSKKKASIPWPTNEYYLDKENKILWLMGSWIRAMRLQDKRETTVPGYTIKLCQYDYIQELKANENTRKK